MIPDRKSLFFSSSFYLINFKETRTGTPSCSQSSLDTCNEKRWWGPSHQVSRGGRRLRRCSTCMLLALVGHQATGGRRPLLESGPAQGMGSVGLLGRQRSTVNSTQTGATTILALGLTVLLQMLDQFCQSQRQGHDFQFLHVMFGHVRWN